MTSRKQFEPWFKGSTGSTLFYRVNRRPLPQTNLFTEQPEDILDHISEALLFGEPIETSGRGARRTWFLGNRDIQPEARLISGRIGWVRSEPEPAEHYDASAQNWIDSVDEREVTAASVFVFDATNRELAVVKHPSFSEITLASIFTELLNRGEEARDAPTTDWDVEPILDEADFREWLRETPIVESVTLVAKLPNPDPSRAFDPVISRMREHRVGLLKEILEAADPEVGLVDLEGDPVVEAHIAMASQGFGYISSRGSKLDRGSRYDSRTMVKRETAEFPDTWPQLIALVVEFLRRRRDARQEP